MNSLCSDWSSSSGWRQWRRRCQGGGKMGGFWFRISRFDFKIWQVGVKGQRVKGGGGVKESRGNYFFCEHLNFISFLFCEHLTFFFFREHLTVFSFFLWTSHLFLFSVCISFFSLFSVNIPIFSDNNFLLQFIQFWDFAIFAVLLQYSRCMKHLSQKAALKKW